MSNSAAIAAAKRRRGTVEPKIPNKNNLNERTNEPIKVSKGNQLANVLRTIMDRISILESNNESIELNKVLNQVNEEHEDYVKIDDFNGVMENISKDVKTLFEKNNELLTYISSMQNNIINLNNKIADLELKIPSSEIAENSSSNANLYEYDNSEIENNLEEFKNEVISNKLTITDNKKNNEDVNEDENEKKHNNVVLKNNNDNTLKLDI